MLAGKPRVEELCSIAGKFWALVEPKCTVRGWILNSGIHVWLQCFVTGLCKKIIYCDDRFFCFMLLNCNRFWKYILRKGTPWLGALQGVQVSHSHATWVVRHIRHRHKHFFPLIVSLYIGEKCSPMHTIKPCLRQAPSLAGRQMGLMERMEWEMGTEKRKCHIQAQEAFTKEVRTWNLMGEWDVFKRWGKNTGREAYKGMQLGLRSWEMER